MAKYQKVGDKAYERTDHVWKVFGNGYLCCLCGGFTRQKPPPFPTPQDWLPETFIELNAKDRAQVRLVL